MIVVTILAAVLAIVALSISFKAYLEAYKKKRELVYEIEVEKKNEVRETKDPRKMFNENVWMLRDDGKSQQAIANMLGVSRSTVRRELKKGRLYE